MDVNGYGRPVNEETSLGSYYVLLLRIAILVVIHGSDHEHGDDSRNLACNI